MPRAQGIGASVGANAAATFVYDNLDRGPDTKVAPHECEPFTKDGKVSAHENGSGLPENPFAVTGSETDLRNVAVADVRFSLRHHQAVVSATRRPDREVAAG